MEIFSTFVIRNKGSSLAPQVLSDLIMYDAIL